MQRQLGDPEQASRRRRQRVQQVKLKLSGSNEDRGFL